MIPGVALDTGFTWLHENLERTLYVLEGRSTSPSLLHTFESTQYLPHPVVAVFPFFAEAENLQTITPPSLDFSIRSASGVLRRGAIIEYTLRLHGVPFRWKTMISHWNPPLRFDDVQLHGPYALWHHRHEFLPLRRGVTMSDRVLYALPLQPFGDIALPLVQSDVRSIFAFRAKAVAERVKLSDAGLA